MEDKTVAQLKLNIGNIFGIIVAGEHVAVRGYKNSAGNLVATRIERNADTKVVLQGPLEAATSPTLKILGLTVTTSSTSPVTKFEAADGSASDAATFFGTAIGTIVKVEGTKTGTGSAAVITATEVEIEN